MKRELAQGVGKTLGLEAIAAGLNGKEMADAVKKEKEQTRDSYQKERLAAEHWDKAIAVADKTYLRLGNKTQTSS